MAVYELLSNEKYCEHTMLIKTFKARGIGSKRKRNDGQATKYLVLSKHPRSLTMRHLRQLRRKRPGRAMKKGPKRESKERLNDILLRGERQSK